MLTLEDNQIRLESRVSQLDLFDFSLQALANALRDGSAINFGSHS